MTKSGVSTSPESSTTVDPSTSVDLRCSVAEDPAVCEQAQRPRPVIGYSTVLDWRRCSPRISSPAMDAACARLRTPSLAYRWRSCVLTVFSLM